MKGRHVYFLLLALLLLWPGYSMFAHKQTVREQNSLRIMSYNIRSGHGLDNRLDINRTASVINRVCPDIVAVEEVDSVTQRSAGANLLAQLGEATLMHHFFAPSIPFEGGKYGIGILSKEKPIGFHYIPLPGREEARVLLVVEFKDYLFCCTHLSLTREDRLASLPVILQEAQKAQKPFFIAGDMNTHPDSQFIEALQKDFVLLSNPKQNTFPADSPIETIDYIAAYKKQADLFSVVSNRVVDEPAASDHRPIVANVVFKQPVAKLFRTTPYLQNPFNGGVTVMWQTTVPARGWVEYGDDTTHLQKVRTFLDGEEQCNGSMNKIRLNNLQPGKTYYYRVCSQEILYYAGYKKLFGYTAVSPFHTFCLPSKNDGDFTALIFNDLHQHAKTFHALFNQLKGVNYNFVIFNGDCIADVPNREVATHFMNDLNTTIDASEKPVFYLRGNHEIRDAYSLRMRELFDYPGGKTYGAFNWGDTRFVMLDCGEDKPDTHWVYYGMNDFSGLRAEQAVFLKNELKSNAFKKAAKRVLVHHVPVYGNTDDYQPCKTYWGNLLAKAPFDVSINAHIHAYTYLPKGKVGNNFPVFIGGGYDIDNATVMVLTKKGKTMSIKVLNTKGEVLKQLDL